MYPIDSPLSATIGSMKDIAPACTPVSGNRRSSTLSVVRST